MDVEYALLDFGDGRRLERFGSWIVDRPCPAVDAVRASRTDWPADRLIYHRRSAQQGSWSGREIPECWTMRLGPVTLELRPSPSGQVGVFPEQRANWRWTAVAPTSSAGGSHSAAPNSNWRVLNLFGYTGAGTLAAAAAGAAVTHVDAAAPAVRWGRRNAELSGLSDRPIRWIVDDARRFVARELRRGARYNTVVLDPPSYGHGPRAGDWRFERDLPELLDLCRQITDADSVRVLLTCHPANHDPRSLAEWLSPVLDRWPVHWTADQLVLRDDRGRELPSGLMLRGESSPS